MTEVNIEINIEEAKWQEELPFAEEIIRKSCISALNSAGITSYVTNIDISVLLTNNKSIRSLNSGYRKKDKPTNVLSFPLESLKAGDYEDIGSEISLGDIVFALETIQSESAEQKKPVENHLAHLAVHGTLHLIGYDHRNNYDAEIMESLEIKILAGLGIESPY